jgi:hypothetical protein
MKVLFKKKVNYCKKYLGQRYSKPSRIYLQTTEGHATHSAVQLQFLHDRPELTTSGLILEGQSKIAIFMILVIGSILAGFIAYYIGY